MVAARANWKGFIKFGEVAVAVALYTAASSSERIAFNTILSQQQCNPSVDSVPAENVSTEPFWFG